MNSAAIQFSNYELLGRAKGKTFTHKSWAFPKPLIKKGASKAKLK